MKEDKLHTSEVLGVKIHVGLGMKSVLNEIENGFLKDGKCHYICTTNPEFIVDSTKDREFRDIINRADLSLPDGGGILFALKYLELVKRIPKNIFFPLAAFVEGLWVGLKGFSNPGWLGGKITGVGLTEEICRLSHEKHYSIFMLGGWPKNAFGRKLDTQVDMATKAADTVKIRYPNVNIIGSTSQFSYNIKDDEPTLGYIRKCMKEAGVEYLDFLLVAYNYGHQEKWIVRNAPKIPAKVSAGVGGTFDYLSGYSSISPERMRKRNIEWVFRLFTQPWRFSRILKAFPIFPLKIYLSALNSSKK